MRDAETTVDRAMTKIATELFQHAKGRPQEKTFVMLVGFSQSGKHALVQHHPVLREWFPIDSSVIHGLLMGELELLGDDSGIGREAFPLRQAITRKIRQQLFSRVIWDGYAIVSLACNLARKDRREPLAIARSRGYRTAIIHVTVDEQILQQRLREADQQEPNRLISWQDLYQSFQRPRFNRPEPSEADLLLHFKSERDRPEMLRIQFPEKPATGVANGEEGSEKEKVD